jgi:hypothetical protein
MAWAKIDEKPRAPVLSARQVYYRSVCARVHAKECAHPAAAKCTSAVTSPMYIQATRIADARARAEKALTGLSFVPILAKRGPETVRSG